MKRRARAWWRPTVLLLPLLAAGASDPAAAATLRRPLEAGLVAVLTERGQIELEAEPLRNEGLLAFSRRLCGTSAQAARLGEENGGVERLRAGVAYRVPLELLEPELARRVLVALFPADRAQHDGWAHTVGDGQRESLWRIAEWFTGRGVNYREIRRSNGLADEQIRPGQRLVIPESMLRPSLRAMIAEIAAPAPVGGELEYAAGRSYAVYRLQAGEALYSSVVVRFTGRLFADDVNRLALEIAAGSGIDDVTDIPVGYPVKIPFELLSPRYLPAGHPGREEYEANRTARSQFSNRVRTRDLDGVTVILDAGHGGRDVGASLRGVWESVYVYDIMRRTQRRLEELTAAQVVVTTSNGDPDIVDRDVLPLSRRHTVLTSPPYVIADSKVGTNLRWYLANSVYRRRMSRGSEPDEVVFVSIHADSLHPSLRGAMVYVPGLLPSNDYGKNGPDYSARQEFKEQPRVSFSRHERVHSEGLSRELAQHIIASFAARALAVHPNEPVRDKIVRGRGRAWVPAVLRYNAVPAKVLVEVCNLANAEDLELIKTRAFRQQVSEALAEGILAYYGDQPAPGPQLATAG